MALTVQTCGDPVLRVLDDFVGTRDATSPGDRRRAIVKAARGVHERMRAAPPTVYYRSCDLVRAPYPTRFALREACTAPAPFVHILNRLFVVQFETVAGLKTLLVSPTDPIAASQTPFFRRLRDQLPAPSLVQPWVAPIGRSVAQWLEHLGIKPESVDYVTYDHLHTQDLRPWFGDGRSPGLFPNAKLLVTAQEWASVKDLLAPQRDWYCPFGTEGVDEGRVVCMEGDTLLGDSILLMRTPGHTEGNHSIVVATERGPLVTSENGVAPECWAPLHSKIPGVRRWAQETGMDVVINGNTLEGGLDQYLSMVQEREVAGPSHANPDVPNVVPSSELAASWLSPGIRPTFFVGELELGRLVRAGESPAQRVAAGANPAAARAEDSGASERPA